MGAEKLAHEILKKNKKKKLSQWESFQNLI